MAIGNRQDSYMGFFRGTRVRANKEFNIFKSEVFYHAIDKALEKSCAKRFSREPCYTAALTNELPKILNEIIDGESKKMGRSPKYRFSSCYIHQKPYVKFGTDFDFRCELGDLLVLVKKTINGTASYNSALFQLKKTSSDKFIVHGNEGENPQLTLYTKWGLLKIDLTTEATTRYDITPHAVSQGASYMFIRSHRIPKFVVAVPDHEMITLNLPSLGCYLSDMIEWRCGRVLSPPSDVNQRNADDWSRLIWRVIDLLKNAICSCKGYGAITRDNGCGSLAFMTGYHEIDSLDESEGVIASDESDLMGFGILYIEELNDTKP